MMPGCPATWLRLGQPVSPHVVPRTPPTILRNYSQNNVSDLRGGFLGLGCSNDAQMPYWPRLRQRVSPHVVPGAPPTSLYLTHHLGILIDPCFRSTCLQSKELHLYKVGYKTKSISGIHWQIQQYPITPPLSIFRSTHPV